VTVFKDMHTYLLQSYLYTSTEPYLISLLTHAETDLQKRPGITEAEKLRIQELLARIKHLKDYEQGPGVYIKHFQKSYKRTFHFNKNFKIEKKEHLDIRYQFYLDAREVGVELQRPPCCSQWNPNHIECGCNKINVVELRLGKFRPTTGRRKAKKEEAYEEAEKNNCVCLNQFCKYCGTPIFEEVPKTFTLLPSVSAAIKE